MAKDFATINFLLYQVVKLNDLNEALFLRCVLVTVGVLTNLIVLSYYHSVGTAFNPVIHCVIYSSTHVKISQLVPSLQTSRQQTIIERQTIIETNHNRKTSLWSHSLWSQPDKP